MGFFSQVLWAGFLMPEEKAPGATGNVLSDISDKCTIFIGNTLLWQQNIN